MAEDQGEEQHRFGDPSGDEFDPSAVPTAVLSKLMLETQREAQRQQAMAWSLLAEMERRRCVRNTAFRSTGTWLSFETHDSRRSSGGSVERALLLNEHLPELGDRYRQGRVNDSHVRRFLQIWRRTELRGALLRDWATLLSWTTRQWAEFWGLMAAWEELVDPIDPNDAAAKAHAKRGFAVSVGVGHQVMLQIDTTTAEWGQIEPLIDQIARRLFDDDWAAARAEHGDAALPSDLGRTDSQRMHDALIMAIRTGGGHVDPGLDTTLAVVIDAETFEEEAARRDAEAAGEAPQPRDTSRATERAATRRCHTVNGVPLCPSDAFDYALAGKVRTFVFDTTTNDFTASRAKRLFTGNQRLGIILRNRHCAGPGCDTPAHRCQIDHTIRHTDNGPTTANNAEALCRPCHRHKTRLETLGLWPALAKP